MKAALNGVPQLLDPRRLVGRDVRRLATGSTSRRSTTIPISIAATGARPTAAFEVIENEIVPLFYARHDDGLPHGWIERITTNWATLGWNVIAGRMVRDYVTEYYEPAAVAPNTIDRRRRRTERANSSAWKQRRRAPAWPDVHVRLVDNGPSIDGAAAGETHDVVVERRSRRRSGHDEIVVQLLHGPLLADGSFDEDLLEVVSHDGRRRRPVPCRIHSRSGRSLGCRGPSDADASAPQRTVRHRSRHDRLTPESATPAPDEDVTSRRGVGHPTTSRRRRTRCSSPSAA